MSVSTVSGWLGLTPEDEVDVERLLADSSHETGSRDAIAALRRHLGSYREANFDELEIPPLAWLRAYVEMTPELVQWHRDRGVPDEIIRATFVDLGRNVAIHRRTQGEFGLDNWSWLIMHYTGMMFALGRLNFALHHPTRPLPGVEADDWIIGMHIPESGPLTDASVTRSLDEAWAFFARSFPAMPVRAAICDTWLLDPYLAHNLPDSNIAAFARRFELVEPPEVDASVALFFLFRTRELSALPPLPHPTALQSLVIDRLRRGDPWTVVTGIIRPPDAVEAAL